jgi:prepilin-type N-terminal cleavage/methylation domain-containing protein
MSINSKQAGQRGFTLIELMMVVLLLSIVVGAVFSQIERAQVRYRVEDQ